MVSFSMHGQRDVPVALAGAGRHHALHHFVRQGLVGDHRDLARRRGPSAASSSTQHRAPSAPRSAGRSAASWRRGSRRCVDDRSPCTNSWSFVIITTTDCFGFSSAIDCGIWTPLLFWITSTSAEYTSRNATMTDMMSISGIRLSSTSVAAAQVVLRHAAGAFRQAHECFSFGPPLMARLRRRCR